VNAPVRKYGESPFRVAVIHGGPGAPGGMAPVARELSADIGILEPLQTASSVQGQVLELAAQLEANASLPVTLVGASWGAMLSYLLAAHYPESVQKIIMVGSAPYEDKYAEQIMQTRLSRLDAAEKNDMLGLLEGLSQGDGKSMTRLGAFLAKTDVYNPLPHDSDVIECQHDLHAKVWKEAAKLRKSGELLEIGRRIRCSVLAIHGDYDPHPAEGVAKPLSTVLNSFRFLMLDKCGHEPWIEAEAKDRFYAIIRSELGISCR
jgi:pimeloyl-ACP methyl ester carboxylesterase